MIAHFMADGIMLLHLLFVLFVVFGALIVLRYHWLAVLHVPAAIWGAWIELSGGVCPLTYVENDLRRRAGESGLDSGFIEHYIYPLLYPPGLTRNVQWLLGAIVLGINVALYTWILLRRRRQKPPSNSGEP
jgi:hypothetical protein